MAHTAHQPTPTIIRTALLFSMPTVQHQIQLKVTAPNGDMLRRQFNYVHNNAFRARGNDLKNKDLVLTRPACLLARPFPGVIGFAEAGDPTLLGHVCVLVLLHT